jgi:hypothetical protein
VATSRSSIKIADCQDRTTNSTTNQRRCTALSSKPLAVTPSSKVATLQSNSHSYATGHPRDTTTSKPSLVSAAPTSRSESNASIVSAEFKRVPLEQGHHVNPSLGGSRCVHQQESTTEASGRVAKQQLIFRCDTPKEQSIYFVYSNAVASHQRLVISAFQGA